MHFRRYAAAGLPVAACLAGLAALAAPGTAHASTGVPPAVAAAKPASHQPAGFKPGCPTPASILQMQCQSAVVPKGARQHGGVSPAASVVSAPLSAADLQSAYGIGGAGGAAATRGTGQTVAIVDAYRDPAIATDLGSYRSANGLPACGSGCFTVYNQAGAVINPASASSPPTPPDTASDDEVGWENETALDVEMVSAICPNCKIDLFEANSASESDLMTAEKIAAGRDAFVSNSWNGEWGTDYPGVSSMDARYVNYPGRAIVFASGDAGYGAAWPATSPLVTSVGGTYLDSPSAGTWTQSVWNYLNDNDLTGATAAGCSSGEPEPSWEPDATGNTSASWCANRTDNDVSAAADAPFGIGVDSSVTDAANYCDPDCGMAGTSVAAPVITAMYALAGTPAANTYPASYLYQNPGDLTPVTNAGTDVIDSHYSCESARRYLCDSSASLTAPAGYNGPAGLGVPNGNLAPFTETETDAVSIDNPGAYDLQTGQKYGLPAIKAYDYSGAGSAKPLTYSATGLPAGLSISPSTGAISGTVASPANSVVHVTVSDGTAKSAVSFRIAAVKSLTASYHAASGLIRLDIGGMCLHDPNNSSANGTVIQVWKCVSGQPSDTWSYQPGTRPGSPGTVRIHGKCLNVVGAKTTNGAKVNLYQCNGKANQQWAITGVDGQLYNPVSAKCLNDPAGTTKNGADPVIWTCDGTTKQAWQLPSSEVTSGVAGLCVNDAQNSTANGAQIVSWACNTNPQQKVQIGFDGTLRINGKCLNALNDGTTDGTKIQLFSCGSATTTYAGNYWELTANGTILNYNSGLCLAIGGNSAANGTRLTLQDCYGQPGEIWAVS